MHNVRYHLTDDSTVQIPFLNGALVPVGDNAFPVLDDKNSFRIRIDSGEIEMSPGDLANILNSYVFAKPNSPLSRISIAISNGRLLIKGRLRQRGNLPFETQSVMTPTPDGRIRLHSEKIRALHLPVKGLMDAIGIDFAALINSGKVPGVQSENNDLIFDLSQTLPPPHLEGKVTDIRIERNSIVQVFGGIRGKPRKQDASYMSFQGNRMRFGKLTVDDADILLYDMNPAAPLNFYLDHYKEQLAGGYAKITTSAQLRVFLKDYVNLPLSKAAPKKKQP